VCEFLRKDTSNSGSNPLRLIKVSAITKFSGSFGLDTRKDFPLYLFGLTLLLFFPGLGARDFWAPVEPRYAEIARVMFSKNEWIVPTVNGDLYTDKPILYFWLVLIASKIFGGVSEWTVRLPAAIGGVGFVVATYLMGRDFFSARVGFYGAIILATSVRVIWESRWAHIDMLFCFFFVLTIYFGARSLLRKGNPYEILLAYVFMALATLAKGLIGVVLPGLMFFVLMVARRDWRMIVDAKLPLGIPIFLLITAPWFYLVNQATNGKWLADFIYIHHVKRYTAGVGHRQPFYYYFTTLPADFLPWTIFALPALLAYRPYCRLWTDSTVQFFFLWFAVIFLFFSISDTKRELYLLPLLPTIALFVANYFNALATNTLPQDLLLRWWGAVFFAIIGFTGLALPLIAWQVRPAALSALIPASGALAVGGMFAVGFVWRRRPLKTFAAVSAMMAATILSAPYSIFPYLEEFKSDRAFSSTIKWLVPGSAPLYVYSDTMNDFNYYSERESIPVLASPAAVERAWKSPNASYLLIKNRDLKRLPAIPADWIVASDSRESTTWYLVELNKPSPNDGAQTR
jgi:4-amino-4-deoxy-L-arabinose transferase-like glycosyltransferase